MQSETGFPSSHQLKSYVASKSRLKSAARAVLSADAGLLVNDCAFAVFHIELVHFWTYFRVAFLYNWPFRRVCIFQGNLLHSDIFYRRRRFMGILLVISSACIWYRPMRLLWSPYVIGGPLYFCPVISIFFFLLLLSFFASPNLSGHKLDLYHTSKHGVALVRI